MKTWLVSFPRSGDTLLRIFLYRVFGLKTESAYEEGVDFIAKLATGEDSESKGVVGSAGLPTVVKTHDDPIDDGPCIYVVRDGRAALASYRHFLSDFYDQEVDWRELVVGRVWPGSWSTHYKAWDPLRRKQSLLIRFEDLRSDPSKVCADVGSFLDLRPQRVLDLSFDDLQRRSPKFFKHASDAMLISEMAPFSDLFFEHHGDVMRELGYVAGDDTGRFRSDTSSSIGRLAREKDMLAGALVDREADLASARHELNEERKKTAQLALDKEIIGGALADREADLARERAELVDLRERVAVTQTLPVEPDVH